MYRLIWYYLPGNNLVKTLIVLNLIAALVFVLFQWGFPWLMDEFELRGNTVG